MGATVYSGENLSSVFIALFGLLLVVGAVYAGVKSFSIDKDFKDAQVVLDSVLGKTETLKDGESNTFLIKGVEKQMFVGYDSDDIFRPEKCFLDSCVCICPVDDDVGLINDFKQSLDTYGVDDFDSPSIYNFFHFGRIPENLDDFEIIFDPETGEPMDYIRKADLQKRSDICQQDGICRTLDFEDVVVSTEVKVVRKGHPSLDRFYIDNKKLVLRDEFMELEIAKKPSGSLRIFVKEILSDSFTQLA